MITSDLSCLPEVASDAALFVNPENPADIARALKAFICPDVHEDLTRKGFQRARLFTWESAAEETEKAYAEVLGRGTCR